jgi:DNA-binding transcriptional MerR regulator
VTEYRIDDLARAAGTTVRNIRAYRDRGLVPPPRRHGRIALYDETHVDRLRLIGALLHRGYTLANIAELIEAWEGGRDVGELLGVDATEARVELAGAGVPLDTLLGLGPELRDQIDRIAANFVEVMLTHACDVEPADLIRRLRPIAQRVVAAELDQALEERVQDQAAGRLAAH